MYFPLPTCWQLGVDRLEHLRRWASGKLARAQKSRRATFGSLRSEAGKGCGFTMQMGSCFLKMEDLIRSLGSPSTPWASQDQPVPAASVNKSWPCPRPQLPEENLKWIADSVTCRAGLFPPNVLPALPQTNPVGQLFGNSKPNTSLMLYYMH